MKKYLFAALAFASLAFAGCDNPGGIVEKEDYKFENSHMLFNFNIGGELAKFIEVEGVTTLPASQGKATFSSDGTKHSMFISNIDCPAEFDIVFTLSPKSGLSVESSTKYNYTASYDYVVTRNFDDGSHIEGSKDQSDEMTGTVVGKNIENFFNIYKTNKFSFKITVDGFVDTDDDAE